MSWRLWSTTLRADFLAAQRQSVVVYLVIAPIVIAGLLRLVIPYFEAPRPTIVASEEIARQLGEAVEAYVRLEVVADVAAVERRVLEFDDVVGWVSAGPAGAEAIETVVQGNEPPETLEIAQAVLRVAKDPRDLEAVSVHRVGHGGWPLLEIIAALTIFCILLIAGLATGFNVVEQRESGVIRAYAVSALPYRVWIGSKLALSSAAALVLGLGVACVLAFPPSLSVFGLVLVACLPSALLLGLIVGAFARDQLTAIAMLKGLLFFFTSLPAVGFVLPPNWQFALWAFPNHWAVQSIYAAIGGPKSHGSGEPWWLLASVAGAVGAAYLLVVLIWMRNRLMPAK